MVLLQGNVYKIDVLRYAHKHGHDILQICRHFGDEMFPADAGIFAALYNLYLSRVYLRLLSKGEKSNI